MPNSPQAEYEVAMIQRAIETQDDMSDAELALEVWRISRTAKRPVKDDSWKK